MQTRDAIAVSHRSARGNCFALHHLGVAIAAIVLLSIHTGTVQACPFLDSSIALNASDLTDLPDDYWKFDSPPQTLHGTGVGMLSGHYVSGNGGPEWYGLLETTKPANTGTQKVVILHFGVSCGLWEPSRREFVGLSREYVVRPLREEQLTRHLKFLEDRRAVAGKSRVYEVVAKSGMFGMGLKRRKGKGKTK